MIHMRFKGEGGDFRVLDVQTVDELRPRMAKVVGAAVDVVFDAMVAALSRHGRSQPGDPPGMGTGEYVRSIKKSKPTGRAKRTQRGAVYTRLFWTPTLESGGRVGRAKTRIQARPVWRPVFEKVEPKVDAMFRDGL